MGTGPLSFERDNQAQGSDGETAATDLSESEMRLRLAIEASGIGIFDYDLVNDRLIWDARTRAMFGIGLDDPVTYKDTFLPSVHPEDREAADRTVRAALDPSGPGVFACEYRTIDRTGAMVRWVAARGQLEVKDGRPSRFVGTVRDVTPERTTFAALEAIRERYRLVTRATNDAIWDWDLVKDHVLWNEALSITYGWDPDNVEPTGAWWLERVHPDDRAKVEQDIRSVIDGDGTDWTHEYRFGRADGSYADVLDRGSVVRSPDGTPLRMIGAMLDLTDRNRAVGQLRAVFEGANVGILELDPRDLRALRVNAKLCAIWGASEAEIIGQSIERWTPEEDALERDQLHARLKAGAIMRETLEKRYRRADGRLIWARVNIVAQVRSDERHVTAMIEDITAEKAAEGRQVALIALGDRLRYVETTGDVSEIAAEILGRTLAVSRAGYAAIDDAAGLFTVQRDWIDGSATRLTADYPLTAFPTTIGRLRTGERLAVADVAVDPALAEDAANYRGIATRAFIKVPLIRRGDLVGVLYAHDSSSRVWSRAEIDFAHEVAERSWAALARIRAEEQQRILNRELSHRLKNTLAMAQAIVSQTLRNVVDLDEAKEALVERLVALGKAHDVLLEGESESAHIHAIIASATAIHEDQESERFQVDGPMIHVGPKAALALTLMIHELATNAMKYGALSVPAGRVVIAWALEAAGPEPTVTLTWTEIGGPPVTAPTRTGFGSRLIERGFAGAVGGETSMDFAPSGVVCRMRAPLSGFLARD